MQSGRRLPHAWLTERQHRVSTLDLVGHGHFALLTGHLGGATWRRAAADMGRERGLPLTVHVIGPGQQYEDSYGDLSRTCLPDETGAVLVRPDQVVGWHVDSAPADPTAELRAALEQLLSRHAAPPAHVPDATPDTAPVPALQT